MAHNITEASGEHAPLEKAKFCRYARRSAAECAGSLDYLVDFGLIRETETWPAKWLIHRCISMLVRLVQSLEARAGREKRAARRFGTAGTTSDDGLAERPRPPP